jgi:KDO2-lipid IV(A) lauroyltransferase
MPKRGHYELEYHLVSDDAINTEDGYITKKFTLMLEQLIKSRPELWLWTHRRWKHKPKSTDVIAA